MAQPTAEGVELNAGSGGSSLAVETVGGKIYPAGMVVFSDGADGVTWVTSDAGLPVSGTVTANLSATDNAVLDAIAASLAGPLTVGSHAVTNAGTFAVQVTSVPTTAVTGPLTDTELRASAVPVSVASVPSHEVTNAGTFAVQVTSAPSTAVTGPLTDIELRASAVPVSLASVPSHEVTNAGTFPVQSTLQAGSALVGKVGIDQTTPGTTNRVDATIAAAQTLATVTTVGTVTNVSQLGGAAVPIGAGLEATAIRVTLPTDGTGIVGLSGNLPDTAAGDLANISNIWLYVPGMDSTLGSIATTLNTIDTDTGNIATAVQLLDDCIYVDDADWTDSTSKHALVGGLYQSSPQTITDGDVGPIQVTANGYQIVSVNGTVTVDLGANNDVTLATLPDTAAGDLAAMVVDLAAIEVLLNTMAAWDNAGSCLISDGGTPLSLPMGAASELTLQTIDTDTGNIATSTSSIDGKITACDTGAVVISSGTVTANLSATDNAVLDDIAAKLATIDADTSTLAAAVSTEIQCDIVGALPAGTNAIGKLAANSGVDIGDVDVTSIAAGTNTIGGTISQQSSSVAYDGTTACTIKRATGLAASGTTAMVAAVEGYQIRVLALALFATATATVTNIYIANDDNNIIGDSSNPIPLANDADGDNHAGFVLPWNPGGWFQTDTDNQALNLVLSAAQDVIYLVTYIEVT